MKECETLSARSADQVAEMQKLQAVVGYAFGTCIWSPTIIWKRMCNCCEYFLFISALMLRIVRLMDLYLF